MKRLDIDFPERHQPLREDIHTLGELLGAVLREQGGAELFELVEQDRLTAIDSRARGATADEQLQLRVSGRTPARARDLVRAFAAWFQLVNVAESVHRIRRRREYFRVEESRPQPVGVADAFTELKSQGLSLDDVLGLMSNLSIAPVLIAHPTESTRRTLLRREQRVADLLLERSNPLLAPFEQRALLNGIRTEVTADWQTAEHPRERLNVADEREHVLFYLAEVFYRIVPAFYQEIASTLSRLYGVPSESIAVPVLLRFGTWVGGDMEGSADVHAKSIRETLERHQHVIVNNYYEECQQLAQGLSQSSSRVGVSREVLLRIEEYRRLLPGAHGIAPARHDQMPYRVFLGQIAERLHRTYDGRPQGYERARQLRDDVQLVAMSLAGNAGLHAGHAHVTRLLRRIDTFGFHLATLDLKQHTSVHHNVLAQGLDDPSWATRSPRDRYRRLLDVLERDQGPTGVFDALGKRTLAVFDAMVQGRYRHGAEAVGLYIVSGSANADDVLAPLVLARWAEAYDRVSGEVAMDVAPQFDSVDTLQNCAETLRQLLGDNAYRRHLEARGRLQTVLVGYSASALESGLLASRLAAYKAQRGLTRALRGARESHVLFHSRGGSIARGGGSIDAVVRASPAESISGVLSFTEQGEGISQNYGLRSTAMRTLERTFGTLVHATLAVKRGVALQESASLSECISLAADMSREAWRKLVFTEPGFRDYFRAVTPIDVIERMQIGSGSSVNLAGSLGVQPAAWVYSWAQSRHMLSGWYGAGAGLEQARRQFGIERLRNCYRGWPFFRLVIDDVEAMLARTDLDIAARYDRLAPEELAPYALRIREEYATTLALVLEIKQCKELLDDNATLQRAIALRNPYTDPMHLMQVDLLTRWRAAGRDNRELFEALLASVSGIGRGLQTRG